MSAMFRLEELNELVTQWAHDRNLILGLTPHSQFIKLTEELGELAAGLARNREAQINDSIGDMLVVLIIMSAQLGTSLTTCLNAAWDEIKDRRGVVRNGIFIKSEDL